jgi:hypothetical protein
MTFKKLLARVIPMAILAAASFATNASGADEQGRIVAA